MKSYEVTLISSIPIELSVALLFGSFVGCVLVMRDQPTNLCVRWGASCKAVAWPAEFGPEWLPKVQVQCAKNTTEIRKLFVARGILVWIDLPSRHHNLKYSFTARPSIRQWRDFVRFFIISLISSGPRGSNLTAYSAIVKG